MGRLKSNISLLLTAVTFSISAHAIDIKAEITGKRLVMDGADCAGLYLKNDKVAVLYGESDCKNGLELRVRWLSKNTFVLIEKNRPNDISPPRTYIYEVKSINGKKVTLNEIWTGWNDFKDDETVYLIKSH